MRKIFKLLQTENPMKKRGNQSLHRPNVLQPDGQFFCIGDVHGRIDLVKDLLSRIDPNNDQRLVFLGDYVDRGPNTAETLSFLFALAHDRPDQVVCLKGNHEKMMCDFIDDPLDRGARWLRNGGAATLQSYGLGGIDERSTPDQALDASEALEHAMPKGLIEWLRGLPLTWNSGNIWCVHASMDPDIDPRKQRSASLMWGHPSFLTKSRQDDICVVHGHTIVDEPINSNGRISIDTGAYLTGRLTAAHITTERCAFIST